MSDAARMVYMGAGGRNHGLGDVGDGDMGDRRSGRFANRAVSSLASVDSAAPSVAAMMARAAWSRSGQPWLWRSM
jgi:hypothetical protein